MTNESLQTAIKYIQLNSIVLHSLEANKHRRLTDLIRTKPELILKSFESVVDIVENVQGENHAIDLAIITDYNIYLIEVKSTFTKTRRSEANQQLNHVAEVIYMVSGYYPKKANVTMRSDKVIISESKGGSW